MTDHQQLLDMLRDNPYAWPGGYPQFAITDDGGAICSKCARDEYDRIAEAVPNDGFYITAIEVNWEDGEMVCDHCNDRIESAYAETDE